MYAHAIPQVDASGIGVHLAWVGPSSWVYAPSGRTVQRRPARPPRARDCERLDPDTIAELRRDRERRLSFGTITVRDGFWPVPLDVPDTPGAETAEVFRIDLDEYARWPGSRRGPSCSWSSRCTRDVRNGLATRDGLRHTPTSRTADRTDRAIWRGTERTCSAPVATTRSSRECCPKSDRRIWSTVRPLCCDKEPSMAARW